MTVSVQQCHVLLIGALQWWIRWSDYFILIYDLLCKFLIRDELITGSLWIIQLIISCLKMLGLSLAAGQNVNGGSDCCIGRGISKTHSVWAVTSQIRLMICHCLLHISMHYPSEAAAKPFLKPHVHLIIFITIQCLGNPFTKRVPKQVYCTKMGKRQAVSKASKTSKNSLKNGHT